MAARKTICSIKALMCSLYCRKELNKQQGATVPKYHMIIEKNEAYWIKPQQKNQKSNLLPHRIIESEGKKVCRRHKLSKSKCSVSSLFSHKKCSHVNTVEQNDFWIIRMLFSSWQFKFSFCATGKICKVRIMFYFTGVCRGKKSWCLRNVSN